MVSAGEANFSLQLWSRRSRTPDRLRLLAIVAIVLALVASVVLNLIVTSRANATRDIDEDHEPAILAAQQIQTSLAEADAAAANAFLAGGGEDPLQRQRYERSLDAAAVALTDIASKVDGNPGLLETVTSIDQALVRYSGLIESARASNRQNFPIGAAYLSAASGVLAEEVYPATDQLANSRADEYRTSYNNQISFGGVLLLITLFMALSVLFFFLLASHQYLAKKFRRTINLPIFGGITLTGIVLVWTLFGVVGQVGSLQAARSDGYEDVRTLINLRGLGFRAKAEESQFLIARGGIPEENFALEANKVSVELAALPNPDDGSPSSAGVFELEREWQAYSQVRKRVRQSAVAGDREVAIELALGDSTDAFDEFDAALEKLLASKQATFESEMDTARGSLRWLDLAGPFMLLSGAVLVFFGFQQRIREYR